MLKWQARGKCLSGNRASRCLHLCLTAGRPRPADSDFGLRQVDVAAVDGARAGVAGDGGHVQRHVIAELLAILVRAVQVIVLVLIVEEVPNFSTSNALPRPPPAHAARAQRVRRAGPSYLWMRSACWLFVLKKYTAKSFIFG